MVISCGVIIDTPKGWLICHATGTTRWDLPKGRLDEGETHLECAVRETMEETGLNLKPYVLEFVDLGQHKYIKDKDLHLYYIKFDDIINIHSLRCTSYVTTDNRNFPEVDYYDVVSKEEALRRFGKGMRAWLEKHCEY